MDHRAFLDELLLTINREAYFFPTTDVPASQRKGVEEITRRIPQQGPFDPQMLEDLIDRGYAAGHYDEIRWRSLRHVVASHPDVGDRHKAERLATELEAAVQRLGGLDYKLNMATAMRKHGVNAELFLGDHERALKCFLDALEYWPSPVNFANVLIVLLRLGREDIARQWYARGKVDYPVPFMAQLQAIIAEDLDLALLREV